MSSDSDKSTRLRSLCDVVYDEIATDDELRELQARVQTDESARGVYLAYCQLHVDLHFAARGRRSQRAVRERIFAETREPTVAYAPTFVSSDSRGTVGYLYSGWPVAYLLATVICGIGLLIGAFTYVSQPAPIARQHVPLRSPPSPLPSIVGRITGTFDCRWEKGAGDAGRGTGANRDQSLIPNPQSLVALGDKFALASGLMEITYNTGAKVILQGPATYEVEGKDGGYLSLGKVTARLDKAEGGRRKGEESTNPKSEIRNPRSPFPLPPSPFVVTTPTAIVTDLGTEFGVEVSQKGLTRVHVLQGAVETRGRGPGSVGRQPQRVVAGRAVEIVRQGDAPKTVAFAPQLFTRRVPAVADDAAEAAYIRAVLADRPLGYWPLNEPIRRRTFYDRSGHGFHGSAMNKVEAGEPGPFGGKSRAVTFSGDGYIDLGRRDEFAMQNNFTVEAWVWIDNPLLTSTVFSAVGRDDGGTLGWMLCAYSPEALSPEESLGGIRMGFFAFHSQSEYPQATSFLLPGAGMPARDWTHVAVVYDRNQTARLYRNGKCVESKHRDAPVRVGPMWLSIGWLSDGHILASDQYFWRGRLAHVAVYPQALGAGQIQEHYQQQIKNTAGNGK